MQLCTTVHAQMGRSRSMLLQDASDLYHGEVRLQQAVQGVQAGAQQARHDVGVVHQVVELQLGRP